MESALDEYNQNVSLLKNYDPNKNLTLAHLGPIAGIDHVLERSGVFAYFGSFLDQKRLYTLTLSEENSSIDPGPTAQRIKASFQRQADPAT